jgi:hypothetical protein
MSIIIITLNPSEMLKKSRDTKRISSLKALNNALGIFQATKPTTSTGTAYIVYISIPDSSSTCANLSLPTLPDGYTYQCSTVANYRKTDGTGWIPVNFNSLDIGSPISSLPIDPTNTTSTNLFFTYTTGGSWELNAILESSANKLSGDNDKTSLDGGDSYSTYEIGTDLSLSPYQDTGLVGYWRMDEGTGSTTKDDAASHTGTITGATWKTESDGCPSGNCLYFDGSGDYIQITNFIGVEPLTIIAWINTNITCCNSYGRIITNGKTTFAVRTSARTYATNNGSTQVLPGYNNQLPLNQWTQVAYTRNAEGDSCALWVDGVQTGPSSSGGVPSATSTTDIFIGNQQDLTRTFLGYIDDLRIYNRVLTASEIKAIYEGTK